MTGDRLRQLADAATPGPWQYVGWDERHHFKGVPTNTAIGSVWELADARLVAALGPDAARLLADAIDALEDVRDWIRYGEGSEADAAEKMSDVLARFAALGEPS